jgi:HEAT repeat protein
MRDTEMAFDPNPISAALRSPDVEAQNEAIARAIEAGAEAVPTLLELWRDPGVARAQVMYALERIAPREAEDAFKEGLRDSDEHVRAYAARGLARLGHPDALDALLATLNDAADPLHADFTPSVQALAAFGLDAVAPLLDRMLEDDAMSRLHAQRALEGILRERLGAADDTSLSQLWAENGDYSWDAADDPRRVAVATWRDWLARQGK